MVKEFSPMMQHYHKIKAQYSDCVVFYRLGDFYEMFEDDAVKVSQMLDLTLTGRDCGTGERAPMCGVPFHAAENYISKLISLGEKVAICEQLTEDVTQGKLVERDVVKVVTAGTISDEFIDEKNNNFLLSLYIHDKFASIAYGDITTGELYCEDFSGDYLSELSSALVRVNPSEIIANEDAFKVFSKSPLVITGVIPKINLYLDSEFDKDISFRTLSSQLGIASFKPFGIEDNDICIRPCGALIAYLKQTQKHSLLNMNSVKLLTKDSSMMLDLSAVRNLELTKTIRDNKKYGSLLWVLDKTKTPMGARKLQNWILSPLKDKNEIENRLNAVECFFDNTITRLSLTNSLSDFRDIGRISGKISNNNLLPRDCLNLSQSLAILPSIKFQLSGINTPLIDSINQRIYDFSALCNLINKSISTKENKLDGDLIKYGYNERLDELKNLSINSKEAIAKIEKNEREKTGIKTLKIGYNRVFGYYIEITNQYKDAIPYGYQRKQTLSNAERFITEELKEIEVKILSAEDEAIRLEQTLYNEIKQELSKYVSLLKETADAIAELDVILSFATVSKSNFYSKPIIKDEDSAIMIVDGRHPVVESTSNRFIPNDCVLDSNENRLAIITGPNMAGKSTYMRQVALICLMAHIGCFVPCKSAEIPLIDKIFTRIGASDSLISDQSTFMVEMSETAYILKNATKNSLILLDEIGRGTSTFDGLSIAWAVVEFISKKLNAKTLFATHYHELTELEGELEGVKNYKITLKEYDGQIVFLRKIMRGSANRSFGIEVAELAGINKDVTVRAKEILSKLEKSDILRKTDVDFNEEEQPLSEVERIIKDININNVSPMQAFNILSDLCEKVTEKK